MATLLPTQGGSSSTPEAKVFQDKSAPMQGGNSTRNADPSFQLSFAPYVGR